MNAIAIAPLLLDNEAFRQCLRERDAQGLAPIPGLCVPQVVKPAALANLQAALAGLSPARLADPGQWPDSLQQLHWELSASTTLRPLANLMGKGAVLPDPWNHQGGLQTAQAILPAVLAQHPRTRLYTVLRLDLVLMGTGQVCSDAPGLSWSLQAGDVLLLLAELPVSVQWSADALVWTTYYYSPDPCCCRTPAAPAGGARA